MRIDSKNRSTIVCALRVAAEQYRADAKLCDEQLTPRIAEQFRRQARECEDLLNNIEDEE